MTSSNGAAAAGAPDTGTVRPAAGAASHAASGPVPDPAGHFGRFGGRFAPEALLSALDELTAAYAAAKADPAFTGRARRAAARLRRPADAC